MRRSDLTALAMAVGLTAAPMWSPPAAAAPGAAKAASTGLPAGAPAAASTGHPGAAPCVLVFGQGRNPTASDDTSWDDLNERFTNAVVQQLDAAGRRVYARTASTQDIDPPSQAKQLLKIADERGCITVIETTVFADTDTRTLITRLRVYPVLLVLAAQDGVGGLRFGEPLFVSQRDAPLTPRSVERLNPQQLAAEMIRDYLRQVAHRAGTNAR